MHSLVRTASLGLLVLPLGAQSGPGVIRTPALNPAFTSFGNTINQVSCWRLTGDAPGTWTACITQNNAALITGKYDQVAGTFTPTTESATLGGTSPFGLMLEPVKGRYAVYDVSTGVMFAARSGPGVAFTTSALISGVVGTYVDPSLGYVGGKLKLFYVSPLTANNGIVMQDLDITNPAAPFVSGPQVTVARPSIAGATCHSPTPITGPDGDVEGLWMAENVGGDSDMTFKVGLDPAILPIKIVDGTNWRNNGGVAGGRLLYRDTGFGVSDIEAAWLLGDVEGLGGTMDIFGCVASSSSLATTALVMSTGVIAPITLPAPLNIGQFALDPTVLVNFASMAHADASQEAKTTLIVPNIVTLKGANIAIQGFSLIPATTTYAFTNTAWLNIR